MGIPSVACELKNCERPWSKQLPVLIPADKYKKAEQLSIKDKINRINTHSIAKKTARISQHFKHEAGIAPKVSRRRPRGGRAEVGGV